MRWIAKPLTCFGLSYAVFLSRADILVSDFFMYIFFRRQRQCTSEHGGRVVVVTVVVACSYHGGLGLKTSDNNLSLAFS